MAKFTHSQIESMACPQKHYLAYEKFLRREESDRAPRLGTAIHIGLEARSKALSAGARIDEAREAGKKAIEQSITSYMPPQDSESYEEFLYEQVLLIAMFECYCRRWDAFDGACQYRDTEFVFEIPLGDDIYTGKVDDLRVLPDDRTAIIEHKTTSKDIDPLGNYWLGIPINNQIYRYFYALKKLDIDVETVLYDVLRVPSIKPKQITQEQTKHLIETGTYSYKEQVFSTDHEVEHYSANDTTVVVDGIEAEVIQGKRGISIVETWQMFYFRVLYEIMGDTDRYFQRKEIPILEQRVKGTETELQAEIDNIKWHQEQGIWPRRTLQCRFGGTRCQFCKICEGMYDVENGEIPEGYIVTNTQHVELGVEDE